MMPRALRAISLAAAVLLAALWLAPTFVAPQLAAHLAAASGVTVELEGTRPALPWGVTVARAVVARDEHTVLVTELRARILASGVRVEGRIGQGTLLLRGPSLSIRDLLSLRGAFVRAQSLPLELLEGVVPARFSLRGTADGVYRFGAHDALEGTLSRGAVVVRAPVAFELPFVQVVVSAGREDDGAWRIDALDLRGPPLSATARGFVGRDGQLALQVVISALEEPARSAFGAFGLPTGPLPYTAEVRGTVERPSFSPARASAP